MRRLHIDRHLPDVMLHVWVVSLMLRGDILHRVIVCGFSGPQEGGGVVRDEARLPALFEILAGVADEVCVGDKRALEMNQITDGRTHPDGIPPRVIYPHGWVREITGHEQLGVQRRRAMTRAARPRRVD